MIEPPERSAERDAALQAMLPNVPFDGWTRAGMRAAAERANIDLGELPLLFPAGPRDVAAWFSDWADRQTVAALKRRHIGTLKIRDRIAAGVLWLVPPEYRAAAEKRRAEQLKLYQCSKKADDARVTHRDRAAFVNECLDRHQ